MARSSTTTLVLATASAATALLLCAAAVAKTRKQRRLRVEADADGDELLLQEEQRAAAGQSDEADDNGNCDEKKDGRIPRSIDLNSDVDDGNETTSTTRRVLRPNTITIAYASTTGTCEAYATQLHSAIVEALARKKDDNAASESKEEKGAANVQLIGAANVQLIEAGSVDWWDELLNPPDEGGDSDGDGSGGGGNQTKTRPPIVLFLLPTWTSGTLPPESQPLLTSLDDIAHDWRVEPYPLRPTNLKVAAFGMGSSEYGDAATFNLPAKTVFGTLVGKLGARPLGGGGKSLMLGDDADGKADSMFGTWKVGVVNAVEALYDDSTRSGGGKGQRKMRRVKKGKGMKTSVPAIKEEDERQNEAGAAAASSNMEGCACNDNGGKDEGECCSSSHVAHPKGSPDQVEGGNDDYYSSEEEEEEAEPDVMDLEDLADAMQAGNPPDSEPREMVTPKQAIALKKEGYRLIGTHSAVKLCRWTKHQLRGRGGCYKHTFYGITSYQCMEATPSLACANKCVFCWRHHKNPVGKEWRWKTDDPYEIVDKAVKEHVSMIKETKGIPGVKTDRWVEAHTVRHCALSLVGEPIMYPRINEFIGELHSREISTFLVTNGQHPQAIESLRPVTQLYVSVDAPTPTSLVEIDRPLFDDAWDRLQQSLSGLRDKGQRTVARLTVVKGWNSDEIGGYAKLIALGRCSFVEVKGVTFCGKSDASNLNMSNTPWHHEVVDLCKQLQTELAQLTAAGGPNAPPEYGLACEHKHSCSVLLARVDQFAFHDPITNEQKWRTWIDYEKFHQLALKHASDPTFTFSVEDYVADTPSWAMFGATEEGFDPTDTRHRKKNKQPKYTKFDERGVPTHGNDGAPLDIPEINRLAKIMDEKKKEIGEEASVMTSRAGERTVEDASLVFRGLVVTDKV